MLRNDDAAFSSSYCSYLLYIFFQVGKIKVTAKQGLKILMTKGMRKVRQGVDIFDKRILDSCSSQTLLQNMASSTAIFSSQSAEYKPVSQCMVHRLSGFYFLCFHYSCVWQEGRGRDAWRHLSFSALLFSFFPRKDVLMGLILHRVMFSRKELERVVLESDCSELP